MRIKQFVYASYDVTIWLVQRATYEWKIELKKIKQIKFIHAFVGDGRP